MEKHKPIIGGIFGTHTEWDENGNVTVKDDFHLRIYWDLWHSGAISKLKGNMLHVYLTIAMHLDRRGEGWPTQQRIAELCGINRTTVVDAIKKLVQAGFIEAEKVRGKDGKYENTVYKIKFVPQPVENDHVGKSDMVKTQQNQGSDHVGKSDMESMSEKPTRENQHGKSDTKKELSFKEDPSLRKKDDDGSAADPGYNLIRQMFTLAGFDDVKKPADHFSKYQDALKQISLEKLIQAASKYIEQVKSGEHQHAREGKGAQIVWFLGEGWKSIAYGEAKTRKRTKATKEDDLPESIRKQMEEQAAAKDQQADPQKVKNLEEKRARLLAKIGLKAAGRQG